MRSGRSRHHPASADQGIGPGGNISVLGPDLVIDGQLESTGEILVHGSIAGNVHAPKVTICQDGRIEGDLVAREACIRGRLDGRITAPIVVIEEAAGRCTVFNPHVRSQ